MTIKPLDWLCLPGTFRGNLAQGEGVVQVEVSGEFPQVGLPLHWLKDPQEQIEGLLLLHICRVYKMETCICIHAS